MVHQLIYVSKSITGPRTEEEIENILQSSRARNAANEISGILLFRGTTFLQVLEGPAAAVRETFARIGQDPRHRNIVKLVDQSVKERLFHDWSMGYRNLSDDDAAIVNDILGWSNLILRPDSVEQAQVVALIRRFRGTEAEALSLG